MEAYDLYLVLLPLFFLVAFLYSGVGHGGASGYLAIFAVFGLSSPDNAPLVLTLNIIVASTGFFNYFMGGHLSPRSLFPFIVTSIPAAFLGGMLSVSDAAFNLALGGALLCASVRFLFFNGSGERNGGQRKDIPMAAGMSIGGCLGFLAGLIGIGGGVFLSPILLLMKWADPRQTAAIASGFIVVNSLSGLAGHAAVGTLVITDILPFAVAVFAGGFIGSRLGSFRVSARVLNVGLGLILAVASLKLLI